MGHIQATGFYMIHQGIVDVKYGALYNWYAVDDARGICASGWHVATNAEYNTLVTYLGGAGVAGGKMKEVGLTNWNPNVGATNEVGFNDRGNGWRRNTDGTFFSNMTQSHRWTSTGSGGISYFNYNDGGNDDYHSSTDFWESGKAIRLIKDSTILTHGQTGIYTGNDGKIYRSIAIGASGSVQEWVADNLAETKYRDGSDIPIVTDNAAWAALETGAMCAYDNNWDNVLL